MSADNSGGDLEAPATPKERGLFLLMIVGIIVAGGILMALPWFGYPFVLLPIGGVLIVFPALILVTRLGVFVEET